MRLSGRLTTALAALLVALLAAGTTYALWDSGVPLGSGQFVAGNLDVALQGPATWEETSADVVGTPRAIDPATFRASAGDSLRITQGLTTTLEGDNIGGDVTVSWADGADADVDAGVSGTYTFLDDTGTAVPGAENIALGTPASVTDLPVGDQTWTLVVDLSLDSALTAVYLAPADVAATAPTIADLGGILVELGQVRAPGGGATPAPGTMAALTEDFSTQDTTTWTGWGSDVYVEADGRLRINNSPSYFSLSTSDRYDLRSSSLCLRAEPAVALNHDATVYLHNSTDMWATVDKLGFIFAEYDSGQWLYLVQRSGGTTSNLRIPYSASDHAWWRIREDAGTVYWDTSPDGSTWTQQRSEVVAVPADTLYVHLSAGSFDPSTNVSYFDDINRCG